MPLGGPRARQLYRHASSQLAAWYKHTNPGILTVAGVKVLTIDFVQPSQISQRDYIGPVFYKIREILRSLVSTGRLSNTDADHDFIARLFLTGQFSETEEPPVLDAPTLEDAKRTVSKIMSADYVLSNEDLKVNHATRITISRLLGFLSGAHIFAAGNVIGLARGPVQPGDNVYVLLGCDSSVVVRKVLGTGEQSNFQFVGESYVDHVSQGEAFLGPLPDDVDLISVSFGTEENTCYKYVYVNRVTGDRSLVDPRMESALPPEFFRRFKDWVKHDPDNRLLVDPEVLRRPGVDIEYLNLV